MEYGDLQLLDIGAPSNATREINFWRHQPSIPHCDVRFSSRIRHVSRETKRCSSVLFTVYLSVRSAYMHVYNSYYEDQEYIYIST